MNKETKQFTSFNDFTNLYGVQKTLRFSLIPVLTEKQELEIVKEKGYSRTHEITRQNRTEKFFVENKRDIFEVDDERKRRYKALKYYLTELHKLFIKDALSAIKTSDEFDFSIFFEAYKKFEICKNDEEKALLVKTIAKEKEKIAKKFGDKEGKGGIFQKNR